MEAAERDALELELRRSYDAGDLQAVATAAIRAYGPELYGFLVGLARDADAAGEIFAGACEKLADALDIKPSEVTGADRYAGVECISPHPNLKDPHSPNLRKFIAGINREVSRP